MNYFRGIQKAGAVMIKKAVDVPDFRLGVGKAETLHHIPINVTYSAGNFTPQIEDPAMQPYEKTAYNGVSDGVTDSMFNDGSDAGSLWAAIEAGRMNSGY